VLIGFADAGAQVAPEPRGGAAVPEPQAPVEPAPVVVPAPPTFTPPPGYAPGDVAGYQDEGELPDTQDPPPGGFTVDPPIDSALRERMLGAGYLFPVAGGASFTNDFGAPRASTGFHQGIDLFGPLGTPLLAVTDGTLVNVGWNGLGGHRLWLQGDDGTYFYYAHLSAYAPIARNGARVRAGDVVGFLGNSGEARTTPWHLHFEIHPGGKWAVAPFEYLTRWMGNTAPFAAGTVARRPPADFISPAVVAISSTDLSSAFGLERSSLVAATRLPALQSPGEGLAGGAPEPTAADLLSPTPLGRPFDVAP
jgi:murein DD-endopeptidase MepM/ murein hydrolase activator NlpD